MGWLLSISVDKLRSTSASFFSSASNKYYAPKGDILFDDRFIVIIDLFSPKLLDSNFTPSSHKLLF